MSNDSGAIFVVDDDPLVLNALSVVLSREGYQVTGFGEGASFLAAAKARTPACIILDVQMPGLNGLDVQERLKGRGNRFPVVFITAHDEVNIRERALAAGAAAFLHKPFAAERLIKTLRVAVKIGANA